MNTVALGHEHEAALADFVSEFAAAGEEQIPAFLPDSEWTFAEIVVGFDKQSRGEGLPTGWVPGTTRFLIHEGRILGLFNLRHQLTAQLLRFGGHAGYSVRPSERRKGYGTLLLTNAMELAREKDIDRLLITCEPANIASIGVIEKCGGRFEDKYYHESLNHEVLRYWIPLI